MSIIHTSDSWFDSIYVNNLYDNGRSARKYFDHHQSQFLSDYLAIENTDGANTIYSQNITFTNWEVINGDDSISTKANSTDITIADSIFSTGLGIAIGSIGQYDGAFETVERLRISNITYEKTTHTVYFKTWTGDQVGYPPNGGGGGLGCRFIHSNLQGLPLTML